MKLVKLALVLFGLALLGGCASSKSGDVYSRDQARREMSVRTGVLESVREVRMEGTKSGVGAVSGAAIGGIAGSHAGKGSGQWVGAIVGAVVGGMAGSAVEEGVTQKDALELTVRLDNGQMISVVQEKGETSFLPGDRVRVLSDFNSTRVVR